jgi:branched-chain amino acid transport system substrate-binding protein
MKTGRKINMHRLILFFSILIVLGALTGRSGPAMAAEEKILKWGALEPLSGSAGLWGRAMNQGVEIAVDEFNAKGGLTVGGTRYKIKILAEDDKYTGAAAVAGASKLIYQDGVKFITGPLGTPTTMAIQPITEKEKVLMMTNSSGDALGKDKPYTFRIGPSFLLGIAGNFQAAAEKYPGRIKKIAYICTNDHAGWDTAKIVEASANSKTLGWEIVAKEFYERGMTDFHPLLARVLAKKPDLIETAGVPSIEAALVASQAHGMGYRGLQTGMLIMPKLQAEKGGPGAEGMIGFWGVDYEKTWITKGQKELYEKFRAKWPSDTMLHQVEVAYSGTKGAFLAIEKAGTLDVPTVIKAYENLIWDVPAGRAQWLDFDAYGYKGIKRQISIPHPITELRGGQLNLLRWADLSKIIQEMGIKIEGK